MCSRCNSPSTLRARAARTLLSRPAPVAFWPTDGPQGIEKPGQLRPTRCAQPSAERELSHYRTHPKEGGPTPAQPALDIRLPIKENETFSTTSPNATATQSSESSARRGRTPTTTSP